MRSSWLVALALASPLAAGCGPVEPEGSEGPLGDTEEAQVDPGYLNYRKVVITIDDLPQTPLGEIHILKRASGRRLPGIEYWYVNRAATPLLATSSINITVTDSNMDPPDPDYPDEQAFTEVEYPTSGWGSAWTADPLSYGKLFGDGSGVYLRLATSTTGSVTRVGWYQVIPATASPVYLTPSGHFVGVSSNHATVPSGYRGYDVDQAAR